MMLGLGLSPGFKRHSWVAIHELQITQSIQSGLCGWSIKYSLMCFYAMTIFTLLKHQYSIPWNKFAESSVARTLSLPFIHQILSSSVFTGHIWVSITYVSPIYHLSTYLSACLSVCYPSIYLSIPVYHHLSLAAILKHSYKDHFKGHLKNWSFLCGLLAFCFPIWHSLLFPRNLYNDVPKWENRGILLRS